MTRIDMIRSLPPGTTGYEIGVCEGEFSKEILGTPVGYLVLVDPWKHFSEGYDDPANVDDGGQESRFQRVSERFANDDRVEIIRATSRSVPVVYAISVVPPDWVFIDANHSFSECHADISFFAQYTDRMFLHDYVDNEASKKMGFGVVHAVEHFLQFNPMWSIGRLSDEEWPTVEILKK